MTLPDPDPSAVDDPARWRPRPGDVGFSTIAGIPGLIPYWGQPLLKDACRYTHTFWVVNPLGDPAYPDGRIVQAMPRGAEFAPLRPRLKPGYAYATVDLDGEQRALVPYVAGTFVRTEWGGTHPGGGIGYSWLTYPALAGIQWGLPLPLLKRHVSRRDGKPTQTSGREGNRRRMICSQLVDEGLRQVGLQLFDDGRWPGDVTPGDVYYQLDPRVNPPIPA